MGSSGTPASTGASDTSGTPGTSTAAAPTGSPISIGYIGDTSGTPASTTDYYDTGVVATQAVNAAGGIHGHPLNLVSCDTHSDPATSLSCDAQARRRRQDRCPRGRFRQRRCR